MKPEKKILGGVNTGNYSDTESKLLAFASQLGEDILVDIDRGNLEVPRALAASMGIEVPNGDIEKLLQEAMSVRKQFEESNGVELEGW
jgi:hypothetical protein